MATYEVGADKAYTTLQAAINAASDGDTIVLTGNITEDSVSIDSKDLTIDLGGFTLTGHTYVKGDANVEFKNGKMTVADTDPGYNSAVITTGIYVDSNGDTQASGGPSSLTLTAVTVDGGEAIDSRSYTNGVCYKSTGGLTITDSTIIGGTATRTASCPSIGSNGSTATAVYAPTGSDGDIVITNSVITGGYGKTDAVWTGYVSQLFSPGGVAVSLHGASDVTIKNSTVTGGGSNWYNAEAAINVSNQFSGTLKVEDSTVTGGTAEGLAGNYGTGGVGIYTHNSTSCDSVAISGSTISGGAGGKSFNGNGIEYRNEDVKFTITDSTIAAGNGENASGNGGAISIYDAGSNLQLDKVKLNGEGNGSNTAIKGGTYGITLTGPVEVIGGTLEKTTVNIDASNLDDSTPVLSGNVSDMTYNISGKEGAGAVVEGDSIYITDTDPANADTSVIYINNTWAGSADNAIVGVGKFYGINAFDGYGDAFAYAKENAPTATLVIEKSGAYAPEDALSNSQRDYSDMDIIVKDGADFCINGNSMKITHDLTIEAGAEAYTNRGGYWGNVQIEGNLIVGKADADKTAVVNFDYSEKGKESLVVKEGATMTANNAELNVGDFAANGKTVINDSVMNVAGTLAFGFEFYSTGEEFAVAEEQSIDGTKITVAGIAPGSGSSYYQTNSLLNKLTMTDSEVEFTAAKSLVHVSSVDMTDSAITSAGRVRFASGTSNLDKSVVKGASVQVGIGAYEGQDDKVDTVNGVVVNVTNDSVIDCGGATYAGWVGSGYYGSTADKQAAMTDARYTLNIDKSQASFGYLHVSDDGILNVTGHASDANKYKYDNSVVDFYAGDFIINGTAVFDGTDAWGKFTKVSCDNSDAANPGKLIIRNGAHYESSVHNGANNGTSLTISNSGIVEVDNASMDIDGVSIAATGSFNINSGNIKVRGTVANTNGTFTVSGDSTLNIAKYNGELITLAGGTVLTDTSVTVDAAIDSKIVANGDLTVNANAFTNFDIITVAGDLAITGADLTAGGYVLTGDVRVSGAITSVNGLDVVNGIFNDGEKVYSIVKDTAGLKISEVAEIAELSGKVSGYAQSVGEDYLFTLNCTAEGGEGDKVYSVEVYNNGKLVDVVTSSNADGVKFALASIPTYDNITVDVFVSDKYNTVQIADDYKVEVVDYTAPKFNVKVAGAEVSAVDADEKANDVTISWGASDNFAVTGYIVDVNGEKSYFDGSVTSMDLKDLANGDYAVKVTAIDAAGNQKVSQTDFSVKVVRPVTEQAAVVNDFDGDAKSDAIVATDPVFKVLGSAAADEVTGEFKNAAVGIVEDGWKVLGTGYFNEDNIADVLIQNETTGEIEALFMSYADGKYTASQEALEMDMTGWTFAGIGDVNGDGIDDIIASKAHDEAFDENGNKVADAFVEYAAFESQYDGSFKQTSSLGGIGTDAADWNVIGLSDMDGDNKDDVVWMNSASQEIGYWASSAKEGANPWVSLAAGAADWTFAGIGDFDKDSKSELLWTHKDGLIGYWQESAAGTDDFFTSLGSTSEMEGFTIDAIGDYNGDGIDDILWSADNGEKKAWLINSDNTHTVSIIAC